MARYIKAVCRLCRRQGEKLFLKGRKCNTEKCTIIKRTAPPGQHGLSRTKLSNYGLQLREKQKTKRIYGVLERQFRKYFETASKTKGVTGKVLLQLLERRLDNVVFRMGLATSRAEARQIVRHNSIFVNAKRVNIPSYLIKVGDTISISKKENIGKRVKSNIDMNKDRTVPDWLQFNAQELSATVARLPEKEDLQTVIREQLIVELYSK